MKKLALLLTLAVVFISCEGPQGPPGFNGTNGTNIVAQSFEVTESFSAPDYSQLVIYPNNIEVFDTDMTLIYILWDEVPGNNGGTVDVWRLLPQTVYTDFGEFQYNYDATNGDATIFLDAPSTFDFNDLAPGDLDNQTFRIVILPVDLASNPLLDITDYNSVMNLAGLNSQDIITIE
ncbi:MAG: dihydrolipoamide dehydrogenase [Nonlabens sp.]|uniref:dihydrolipoamide dehydrogenase n=1 Tax=Nonlabens sp. TaxID=1888209 RepID=UPI003EF0C4C7